MHEVIPGGLIKKINFEKVKASFSTDFYDKLKQFISAPEISAVSYVGFGDECVLAILCYEKLKRLERGQDNFEIYCMDSHNRWGAETEFDWETGDRVHASRKPEWMVRVNFCVEGVPSADLVITELPGITPEYFIQKGHVPKAIFLLGELRKTEKAELGDLHVWTDVDDCKYGVLKTDENHQ